jgi:hypothetical protein
MDSSIQVVADFLCHLYDAYSLKPNSIAGYKSALMSVIPCLAKRGSDEVNTLNVLIKGMGNLRPRNPPVIPSWSLSLVLQVLGDKPFEPLSSISMKLLTLKTVFLIAAASARRRSEIHALSAEDDRFVVSGEGLKLLPRINFLAKNQSLKYPGQPIILPALTRYDPNSKAWCPVRALRRYKQRTAAWRTDQSALWLSYIEPHGRASKDTISRWIVECIQFCHKSATGKQVDVAKAHSVRGVVTSTALFNGVPVDDIMSVAQWHCESSFTDHYLRDTSNPLALSVLKK